jgi:hypothetical protein
LHRLQDLVGAVEGVLARVPYLLHEVLRGAVALGVRGYLLLLGGEVNALQVLTDMGLRMDGRERAFSCDPETDRLTYVARQLFYGMQTVKIVATDDAGNRATKR